MKKLLLATFFLTSFSASASWLSSDLSGTYGDEVYASIYSGTDDLLRVGVHVPYAACSEFSPEIKPLMQVKVRNLWLDYSVQCVSDGRGVLIPTSKESNAYVVGAFMKHKTVTFLAETGARYVFSAMGFARSFNIRKFS